MIEWSPTHDLELQELLHDENVRNAAREAKRIRKEERRGRIAARNQRILSGFDLPPARIVLPGDSVEADLEAASMRFQPDEELERDNRQFALNRILGWVKCFVVLAVIMLVLQLWSEQPAKSLQSGGCPILHGSPDPFTGSAPSQCNEYGVRIRGGR